MTTIIYGLMMCSALYNGCRHMDGYSTFSTLRECERMTALMQREKPKDATLECWQKEIPVWHPIEESPRGD